MIKYYVTVPFNIEKTGDDSNVLLFVVLMCAVLVMSFGFVRKKSNCYLSSF